MDIESIIAEATQSGAEQQKASNEAVETPTTPELETQEAPVEEKEDLSVKPDSELTPEQLAKRNRNRESKKDSKLAQMRRANRELQEALAKTQQAPQEVKQEVKSEKPKAENFETWEDYTEALTDWKLEQKFTEQTKQTQQTQEIQQFTQWADQRGQLVDNRIIELAGTIPDFEQTIEEIEDVIPALTPELARVALEADDVNLAAYTLHKEGKLMDVLKLPPSMAAREIAKAEIRGARYLNSSKPATNAPAPISAARGNTTTKALPEKSVEELMRQFN